MYKSSCEERFVIKTLRKFYSITFNRLDLILSWLLFSLLVLKYIFYRIIRSFIFSIWLTMRAKCGWWCVGFKEEMIFIICAQGTDIPWSDTKKQINLNSRNFLKKRSFPYRIVGEKMMRFLFGTCTIVKPLYAQRTQRTVRLCSREFHERFLFLPLHLSWSAICTFDRFSRYQSGARQRKVRDEHSVAEGITIQASRSAETIATAASGGSQVSLLLDWYFTLSSLYNVSNVYTPIYFAYMKVSNPASAKSAAPLRSPALIMVHY